VEQHTYPNFRPFLLMEGGPLYRIEKRVGTIKKDSPLTIRRAIFAAAFTWLPLLILTILQGTAFGHKVIVPFLWDFSAHTRFLLAAPLLLLAEIVIGPRIAEAAGHFVTAGIVGKKDFPEFDAAVEDGLRLRDSVLAEILLVVFAYSISTTAFHMTAVHVSTWYGNRSDAGMALSWAGWWMILFCVPLLQFLQLRWLWRIFLWFRFLGRIGRLDLQLFPTHPDECGGIGFVGEAQRFFGILLFSFSLGLTGVLANEILYDKIPLKHFAPAIGAYAFIALLLMVLPLAVFTPKLLITKRKGLYKYGTLATAYTGSFHRKWICDENPEQEKLLGTADIQSLADLGNSFAFIERMNALPVNPRSLIHIVVATLLPMTALLLTVMPLKDVLKLLLKLVA